jgi:uncharacterized membrane protein
MDADFNADFKVLQHDPKSGKTLTMIVYALQAASFFLGLTLFIAVIINYVKKEDVRGTWLESHFRWQIRTFWFSLLWSLIGVLTFVAVIGYFILIADMLWLIYRIVKGWLHLADGKTMYDNGIGYK